MEAYYQQYQEPYVDTDIALIDFKLKLAVLKPGQLLMDLGCGNANVLIRAVQQYGVKAVGCEILEEALIDARENIETAGLSAEIRLLEQSFLEVDVSQADALVLYHGRNTLGLLSQKLEDEMKPGAVIITHDFDIPAWEATEVHETLTSVAQPVLVYKYLVP